MTEGRLHGCMDKCLPGNRCHQEKERVIIKVKAFKNRDCDVEGQQKSILPQLVKIILNAGHA